MNDLKESEFKKKEEALELNFNKLKDLKKV